MIVCKNAAMQCISTVDSAKDLLGASLYCIGLMVRADAHPLRWGFNTYLEICFCIHRIPDNFFLEIWRRW